MFRILRFAFVAVCGACLLCAQDEPPVPAQAPVGGGGRGGLGAGAAAVPDPQPYERVITKDAKTTKGLFTVHQIKERYYYEIPKSELGQRPAVELADRQDDGGRGLRRADSWRIR